MRNTSIVVAMLAGIVVAGCSSVDIPQVAPADMAALEAAANHPQDGYRLEPGDRVRIQYTFHPELDQDATLRPDGKIRITEVGEVVAAGHTAGELSDLLEARTAERLRDPEVVVSVADYAPKTVYVAGEVGRAGRVAYRRGLTPLQAVVEAGGFADTARIDQVVLVRHLGASGETLSRTLDLETAMKNGEREPVFLAPHDVVFVPRTNIAEANVWVDQHVTQLFPLFRGAGGKMDVGQD